MTAEVGQAFEQALDGLVGVVAAEVIGSEVGVFDAIAQHVVGGREHRGSHREDGLFRAAPGLDAQELGVHIAGPDTHGGPGGGDQGRL